MLQKITVIGDSMPTRPQTISVRVSHDLLIVLATFLVAVFGYLFAEKIPFSNGLGWDGQIYGALAKGEFLQSDEPPLDRYRIQRVLPSILVFAGLKLFRMALTDQNVVAAFGLMNLICITSVGWCWIKIARLKSIGPRGKWLGFCALILNFAVAKHTSYYAVLTDIPAYAIGCWMLYFYLKRSFWNLLSLTFIGAFVWPLLMIQGSLLILFPHPCRPADNLNQRAAKRVNPLGMNACCAGMATFYLLVAIDWSVSHSQMPVCGYINPSKHLLPLSMGIVAVYVFLMLFRMFDFSSYFEELNRLLFRNWRRLIAVGLMIGTIQIAYICWAPLHGHYNAKLYLLRLFVKSVDKPGVFLLGHAVYFGPIVPLIVLLWTRVSREIQQSGVGVALAVILALLLSLDGESRHLNHAFPLIAPFAVCVIEKLNWKIRHDLLFAAFSVFASKIWLSFNCPELETCASLLEFPLQGYAMNIGVFMTPQTYLIQGVFALALTLTLFRFIRASKPVSTGPSLS